MRTVCDLEVGLIDRAEFARRQWYSATDLWYYHRPGRPSARRLRSGFYDLIDEHLREPCLMLHKAGFATLPSCEGHFHGRSYFAEVWQTLQWENEQIRGSGLVLHNSETNELVRFADSAYELPWPNFAGFLEELTRTQVGGYLGVELRREHRHIARELSRSPYQENAATISLERPAEGVWIAAVYVDPLNPEHGASTWKKAGGYLRRLVHLPERHMVVSAPASARQADGGGMK